MSIGIDFILRANSAAFTRGLAAANNSINDVKKSLRTFDVGFGVKSLLGIGGIIRGFQTAVTHAQELRDEAEKIGKTLDAGTRSVAELGDGIAELGKGMKNLLTTGLSFFTRAGEGWGMVINRLRGVTAEQERLNKETEKNANLQEKQIAAARERIEREAEKADLDYEEQKKKNASAGMTTEERRNALLKERTAIFEKMDGMEEGSAAWKIERAKAERLTGEIGSTGRTLMGEAERKQKTEQDAADRKAEQDANKIRDKFAPSVEQLAEMSAGGFADANDPRLQAKRILEKEGFAAEAAGRGDIKGALKFGAEAQAMRDSLGNMTGNGTALTAQTAETALRNALEQTNKELVEVRETLRGIIKAQ